MSELRWDARRGEWVIVAPHRQDRTYHPPVEHCPLCPTPAGGPPTEVPAEEFEIVVFENRFPSLGGFHLEAGIAGLGGPTAEDGAGPALHAVAPARGRCEVVVYTPRHDGSLATLPERTVERLIRVWADRYRELGARPDVRHVFIFENRGAEIGVTLHHPHGQIYAYPFVPPIPAREGAREASYHEATGRCLHCDLLAEEERDGRRIIGAGGAFTAYVPFAARWPFEVHLVARRHRASLLELSPAERRDLAVLLRRTLRAYDALFDRPMPYILAIRQAPTAGDAGPGAHLRVELYPARRAAEKLKVRAGSETAMDVFITDARPEEAAERLRHAAERVREAAR